MNQGKGIFLVDDVSHFVEDLKQETLRPGKSAPARIIQRYIPNPLLLHGKKFDLRSYMLIACNSPFVVLQHDGYVRLRSGPL